MSEGIPMRFSGGPLGGQVLYVDSLRPRWRAIDYERTFANQLTMSPHSLPPLGATVFEVEYELRFSGDGTPYYRIMSDA